MLMLRGQIGKKLVPMKSIRRRIKAFLYGEDDDHNLQIEHIRNAMLNALDKNCFKPHAAIARSINYAADLESLWYLRSDLFHAISSCCDQIKAGSVMSEITMLFKGYLALANCTRL